MNTTLIILGTLNVISIAVNIYFLLKEKKKETYAIILNNNEEQKTIIKINPSDKKFVVEKDTYIVSKKPYIKFNNKSFILYEYKNPEPLTINDKMYDRDVRIATDVFNEILEMEHIRALNKVKTGMFDGIKREHLIIGAVILVAGIMYFTGGF